MVSRSTIKLLRLPFAFFLLPLFFFALSQIDEIDWTETILVFIILHFLIYPASNAYNSYMDQDTGSIGGLKNPPKATKQVYNLSIILDIAAILLSFLVDPWFALMIPIYIAASKAYSWRKIRLKKYPVIGYLTVIIFQGAFTYWLVYYGCSEIKPTSIPWMPMLISTLLIGGFYPLTQIYQHWQDLEDGVQTISYKLGYKGTFIFSAAMYLVGFLFMAQFFIQKNELVKLAVVGIFFLPVIVYFTWWFMKVIKNSSAADFEHTMRMILVAASCTNIAFFILLTWRWLE